jgi:hypothetical protein
MFRRIRTTSRKAGKSRWRKPQICCRSCHGSAETKTNYFVDNYLAEMGLELIMKKVRLDDNYLKVAHRIL